MVDGGYNLVLGYVSGFIPDLGFTRDSKLAQRLLQLRAVTLRLILGSHLVFSGCLERKFPESRGLSAREGKDFTCHARDAINLGTVLET